MAKPIRATPVLKGKDAEEFISQMIKEQKRPSKKRVDFIKKSLKLEFLIKE